MDHQSCELQRRLGVLALVACVVWLAPGCNSNRVTGECAAAISRAIVVAVRDSTTGAAAADGAFGTIQSGAKVDTLTQSDSLLMFGGDRLGTYSVNIEHAGYHTWTATGVAVTQLGSCGNVVPVRLTARLQPSVP